MGNSCTSVFPNKNEISHAFLCMAQEWNKIKKQTKKVRREAWVWKRVKAGTKKRSPDSPSHPNQNTIKINIIWYFIGNGKNITNSINKKQNVLEQSKNEKSSTLPEGWTTLIITCLKSSPPSMTGSTVNLLWIIIDFNATAQFLLLYVLHNQVKRQAPFPMAIEKVKLIQKCCLQHLLTGTPMIKCEGKKISTVSMK